jgi:5-methylcytosine-specific restriction protein A
MKITCKYCGIVDRPHHCPKSKRKTDRTRIDNKVYESKEYREVREEVLEDHNYICLWSLYVDGKIVKAEITHHIIEILEDESKSKDYNNLIPLQGFNHKHHVHRLYFINKEKTQELLRKMIRDFKNGDKELGKYHGKVKEIEKASPPTSKLF